MRWALFQDDRGVLHCEPVDEGLQCWTKIIPAEKATRWTPGRIKETKLHIRFLESHYKTKDYMASAFEPAPPGYTLDPNYLYMKENKWGPVVVLAFVDDDEIGAKLNRGLRKFEPTFDDEGPRPGNDQLVSLVRQLGELN